jgi:hypothetical protein
MTGKLCIKEVDVGLRMVQPKLIKANLSRYNTNITNVAKFLAKVKKDRKKWFITMSVDYFNCLLSYYKDVLKLKGFKVSQIDTNLAKDLYLKFLEDRGSLYWDTPIEDPAISTSCGRIHTNSTTDAKELDLEYIKRELGVLL